MSFTPSRGGRHKQKPLDLFSIAPVSVEEDVYARFKSYAFDLMSKGLGMSGPYVTRCEDWWRSRFHDMIYPGHQPPATHEEWRQCYTAETNWKLFWTRFEKDVLTDQPGIFAAKKNAL